MASGCDFSHITSHLRTDKTTKDGPGKHSGLFLHTVSQRPDLMQQVADVESAHAFTSEVNSVSGNSADPVPSLAVFLNSHLSSAAHCSYP